MSRGFGSLGDEYWFWLVCIAIIFSISCFVSDKSFEILLLKSLLSCVILLSSSIALSGFPARVSPNSLTSLGTIAILYASNLFILSWITFGALTKSKGKQIIVRPV